ncbi:MAG: hypothetical protein V4643_14355 [Bacteroidota bacterium]
MTEEEFYKKKIFEKVGVNELKRKFPHLVNLINNWYMSDRYNKIQDSKSFLENKLKRMSEDEDTEEINLNRGQLYSLFQWWETTPKICYYCSLPENILGDLHNQPGHINKRHPKRGQSLEIDRKQSHLPYNNIDNLVLACYWCNNAKTDTFTEAEFLLLGQVIKVIWQQRLNKQL